MLLSFQQLVWKFISHHFSILVKTPIFYAVVVIASFTLTGCTTSPVPSSETTTKKVVITPSSRDIAHAVYYHSVLTRIEKYGTSHFPKQNGKTLYGDLVIWVPIQSDGAIYEVEGGPRIEKSSGNPDLDKEAIWIVRRAAPYGRFPSSTKNGGNVEQVWELLFTFDFKQVNDSAAKTRD